VLNTLPCSVHKRFANEVGEVDKVNGGAMNVQFKKGVLELCVLVVLCRRDYYGYELVHTICENIDIAEGTIYPLLRRLTKEGYFTTYLRDSEEGPSRKYYQITEKGKEYKQALLEEWTQFVSGVNNLIEEEVVA
jgi:PadR family transcriptional regulator PadR